MKAYRLNQTVISILLLAVLLVGFIPVQSAHATPLAWDFTGSMAAFRANHTATLLNNGKVLVTGGNSLFSAELYNPTSGTWANTASMKFGRSDHTATLLTNGKVLVVGGQNAGPYLINAEIYDPATGLWTNTGSLNTGRVYHTATLLSNGQVLVVGGLHSSTYLASAELYDPTTGLWTFTGSLKTARYSHTATLLPNGQVLVTGGNGAGGLGDYLNTAELYDPTTGTWTYTATSMAFYRKYHTATLLPNDKVLVVGGIGGVTPGSGTYLASAELYNPTSNTWTDAGSLTTGRQSHTATLLAKGQVLIAGGNNGGVTLGSAEMYDPTPPGSWTPLPNPLNNPRYYHTAVQLSTGPNNGQVLVAGGIGSSSLKTAELYDPEFPTAAPGVPVLVSPTGSTSTQPSYIWHYSIGATSYNLTVDSISSPGHVINNVVVNTSFCSGGFLVMLA